MVTDVYNIYIYIIYIYNIYIYHYIMGVPRARATTKAGRPIAELMPFWTMFEARGMN